MPNPSLPIGERQPVGAWERPSSEADPGKSPDPDIRGRSAWASFLLGLAVVLAVFVLLMPARLWRPGVVFDIDENVQIAEAQAWWEGRLDLPERKWDTALRDGQIYSYFPPMFTILVAPIVSFFGGVPHFFIAGLAIAVPLLSFVLFFRLTGMAGAAALLSIGLVCGTSVFPVLDKTLRGAAPYPVNHTVSMIGVLLILIDYGGSRRVWPACLGLVLTALSRQLTIAYALPAAAIALTGGAGVATRRRVSWVVAACLVIGGVYGGLNHLKFGHPLATGYMLTHEGRDDVFAREARAHGLLSLHWVPRNLYYANLGLPQLHRVEIEGEPRGYLRPNTMGTGIWWTSPFLLFLLVDIRRLLSDRRAAILLASAGAVYGMLMFWHATGSVQRGYNRYSLDYIPVLFALLAPRGLEGKRRWLAAALMGFGVFYFCVVLAWPYVRFW